MFNWLNRLPRRLALGLACRKGIAAVEMAMLTPLLALIMVGIYDFGYYLNQSSDLDKSLRVGAMLAARSSLPLSAGTQTTIGNLVKTGTADGTGAFVVPGWSDGAADLSVTTSTYSSGGNSYEVIRIVADVPYDPIFGDLLGLPSIAMKAVHEQVHVGD